MDWLHPTFVWTLVAVPVAIYCYWRAAQRRRAALRRFGEVTAVQRLAATVRPWRRVLTQGLVVAAITAMAVSLMGPRFGTQTRTIERQGVDVVIALDVSESMRAQDVAPSRLARAKGEVRTLLERLRGDRVGLVLFAGTGFVQGPLTTDYGAIRLFLDVAGPDRISGGGTNFDAALEAATEAFDAARPMSDSTAGPENPRSRVVLLVSDGENHEANIRDLKEQARENNVTVYTAGVGTAEGGQIPLYENGRQIGVKRDQSGQVIETSLREDVLTELAEDGAYFRIGSTSSALQDFPAALRQLETATFAEEEFSEYAEMYQWPLAAALFFLLVELCIPLRSQVLGRWGDRRARLRGIEREGAS